MLLALWLSYSWMFDGVTVPNERSRVYLAVSLVDCGSVSIDCAVERFGPVNDWARHEGHYYTDKAPGSSLLAAGVYAVARVFSAPEDWSIEGLINLERRFLMIPISLLGALLLLRTLAVLKIPRPIAVGSVLAWLVGTTALHYSGAFYGHQIVAVSLLAAVYWGIVRPPGGHRRWFEGGLFLGGVACGVAGLVEYQAIPLALVVACIAAYRAFRDGRAAHIAALVVGAAPFAALFLAYNALAFGGPLELSYGHLVSAAIQESHTRGIGGVGLPRWDAIHGVLFSLHRGLLVTSPVFLLLPLGFVLLWRRNRLLAAVVGTSIGLNLLVAFGADAWFGGWSFGPRLLVPTLGLAMVPVALSLAAVTEHRRKTLLGGVVWGALAVGVCYNQIVQAVFPELPENAVNPLRDVIFPMLADSQLVPNTSSALFGGRSALSLTPVVVGCVALLVWFARILQREAGLRVWVKWSFGAVLLPVVFGGYVALQQPSWNDGQRASWSRLIDQWQEYEAR
ncbi:MAG: hypothetical protein CSA66_01315 [Proteobacteria bacterium]|nr:MAG: hypothetical protein CSA66_01315 [Pseudomonadota bacterium]